MLALLRQFAKLNTMKVVRGFDPLALRHSL